MHKKAARRISRRIFSKAIDIWRYALQARLEEKHADLVAMRFRSLSLASKAFNRFRIHAEGQRRLHRGNQIARRHFIVRRLKLIMCAWRRLKLTTRRRYLMVTCVLKIWSHNLQLREFQQWRRYKNMKRERRMAMENALEIYKQRCLRLSLTGFIIAAEHLPVAQEEVSDEELLSSASLEFEDVMPKRSLPAIPESNRLASPKRPFFLGPKPKMATPPRPYETNRRGIILDLDPDDIYETLETKYLELKARLEVEDGEQKEKTLGELNDLMREIGGFRSALEVE
jgi:hypothetical protein